MSSIILEIRAAEGGDHAKLFVGELVQAYERLALAEPWKCDRIGVAPASCGYNSIALSVRGKGVESLRNEAGGHRIQRIPPTERRGRVHTSTVTVVVIEEGATDVGSPYLLRSEKDFKVEWFIGSGAGGSTETEAPLFVILR